MEYTDVECTGVKRTDMEYTDVEYTDVEYTDVERNKQPGQGQSLAGLFVVGTQDLNYKPGTR
ncbi:hypothetical protein [Paenibacillus sp. 7541]|uniref:hypothetical protein n=1 Tax=Paenibacillus sp. 7541 TaxID=2026236 RepID=UPI0015950380|nr:hypothetical protein [Paenibacillus sp. 7541]